MMTLICAYYFHQLLPAITAVIYERETNHSPIDQTTFIYIPHINAEEKKLISTTYPWCTFIPTHPLLIKIAFQKFIPIKIGKKILNYLYKKDFFETIYFSHHATSDFTAQTFIQAFPNAKLICYGDAFGNFIDQDYLKPLIKNNVRNFFSWLKRKIKLLGCHFLNPKITRLMIPINLSTDSLQKIPLEIPTKKHAQQVLNQLQKNNILFNQYISSLCHELKNGSAYLFLLNNLACSKLTSVQNEILLYQAIIEKQVPQKSLLLLKPHAGANLLQTKILANWAIKKGYIVKIFPSHFFTMPIELAEELIKNCHILSTSYPTISLHYFYNRSVIHALDDHLIERYFFPQKKEWAKHQNQIYIDVEKKLNTWDGNSILYGY